MKSLTRTGPKVCLGQEARKWLGRKCERLGETEGEKGFNASCQARNGDNFAQRVLVWDPHIVGGIFFLD